MDNTQRSIVGGIAGSERDLSSKCSNLLHNSSLYWLDQKLNSSVIASSMHPRVGSQMSETTRPGNGNSMVAAEGTKNNARTASVSNPSDKGQPPPEE
jgi:hypothetical protein